jgi:hypothetical protein
LKLEKLVVFIRAILIFWNDPQVACPVICTSEIVSVAQRES